MWQERRLRRIIRQNEATGREWLMDPKVSAKNKQQQQIADNEPVVLVNCHIIKKEFKIFVGRIKFEILKNVD